ncbi:MAG: choline/carnitine/betaine transporter [Clostridiales bacterium]|jgi:choline/carnitine/betaine transport|nr:choline/carnitine/betaine transporter [Clostridiales bacterium]
MNRKNTVLVLSLILSGLFLLWGAILPDNLSTTASVVLSIFINNFGWLYLLSVAVFLIFCIVLAVSPFGKIKLGKDDEKPEHSTFSWFAMLFTTGMGIGLVFWSIAEPMYHYTSPPYGVASSPESATLAMRYVFFHWGLHPWAVFALVGLALGYFQFRKGLPFLVSSIFYPILGDRIYGPIGKTVDILAVFATLFGLATSLGLGTMQINSGLNYLFGTPNTPIMNLFIVIVITVVFTIASITGIEKGIKFIANWTVYFAVALMLFLFVTGPTRFILNIFTDTIGSYLQNIVHMSLWTEPIKQSGWLGSWTIFYWAWWIAWGPFVGQFIARISRGRTIREFILGSIFIPSLFSFIWLSIFGGTALKLEIFDGAGIANAVSSDIASALFITLQKLPLAQITAPIALILIAGFFITSADSGTFVVAMLTSNGSQEPKKSLSALWGTILGGIAAVLLVTGGLQALQTASIASAFPFMLVMLVMIYSMIKGLQSDSYLKKQSTNEKQEVYKTISS